MDSLPRREREVLGLRWELHLSYHEIGTLLGISPKMLLGLLNQVESDPA